MESDFLCPCCNFQYSDEKVPRILSMCGHTICQTCIQTLIVPNGEQKFKLVCPQSECTATCELSTNSFKQFPINKALLKIVQSNKSKSSFKDASFDVSKIVKQQQLQQDQETKQLITAIKQSQQQQQAEFNTKESKSELQKNEKGDEEEEQNLCLLHQKPLQVVCIVDLEKICAKCAIFGEHKGHQFKSIEQIQQENQAFYHQLLAIYDQKTEIMKRVEDKTTKQDLISILLSNKQNLTKQIKDRFKKITEVIKNQEKKAFSKLQKVFQKVQKDIDDLYRITPETIQKYEQWERHSFQKMQIIQKGSFEEKLELLLIDMAKPEKNIITQGKFLVGQIKNQEDHIINKAEVFLGNITMKTNDTIFEFTESFVQIFDKPPEPVKVETIKQEQQKEYVKEPLMLNSSAKKGSEDDLLYVDPQVEDFTKFEKKQEVPPNAFKTVDNIKAEDVKIIPVLQSKATQQNLLQKLTKKPIMSNTVQELHKTTQNFQENKSQYTSNQNSFVSEKIVRPTKKKLKSIKIPQKYEKVLESLYADTIETLDLTNAELGDNVILQICQFIPGTKVKTVKFIRNKLNDDVILKILPYLTGVITLNLSQNLLSQRVLDIFIHHRQMLPKVKSIILSLNKIIQRKHKNKIDELRKFQITVSV